MSNNLPNGDWMLFEHWNKNEDIKFLIEKCINRLTFILIYIIDIDILINGICFRIRENIRPEDFPCDDELLEDKVGQAVKLIAKETFCTKKEVQSFLTIVGNRMLEMVSENNANKIL